MTTISDVFAREILDSRGNPTIEVEIELEGGVVGSAAVPSGASTGEHEAHELRDGDNRRYLGKGVTARRAERHRDDRPRDHGPRCAGAGGDRSRDDRPRRHRQQIQAGRQRDPRRVDGRGARGGRARSGCRCGATSGGVQARILPTPLMNVINGGAHADNGLEVQEFMIVPIGALSFRDALRAGVETFHTLKGLLKQRNLSTAVGDEGGFAPRLERNEAAIQVILEAIEKAGYRPGEDIAIALDAASSEFFDKAKNAVHVRRQAHRRRAARSTSTRRSATSTRSSRSKTAAPRTTGMAGGR